MSYREIKTQFNMALLFIISIGVVGHIIYTFFIMPFKYAKWLSLEAKNDPEYVLKPYGYYYIAYGFSAVFLFMWIQEICTNKFGFTAMTHAIFIIILYFPVSYSITGIKKEFSILQGEYKWERKDGSFLPVEFAIRIIISLVIISLITAAIIQAYYT
jgi:ABC-type multidrug transport system permease subunit